MIALVCYVIPLHMRDINWIKDFGLATMAVVCYAAIIMAWYGLNFIIRAGGPVGLHSYGFGSGSNTWVYWAALINIAWVLAAGIRYLRRMPVRECIGSP